MEEKWERIPDFPEYLVSSYGRIFSEKTNQELSTERNKTGIVKVNLMRDGQFNTRSVTVLVAKVFLPEDPTMESATPINIDGDPFNNHVENLAWRPRWFAWKYTRQFHVDIPPEYCVPVHNMKTGEVFPDVPSAGVEDGVLWEYVYNSCLTERPVYPTGAVYEFA